MSFGPIEAVVIVVIVLVIFGAGRLTGVGKALGMGLREFRQEASMRPDSADGEDEDGSEGSSEGSTEGDKDGDAVEASSSESKDDEALRALRKQWERDEISADEYERRRREILGRD